MRSSGGGDNLQSFPGWAAAAVLFLLATGCGPSLTSLDPWERRLAVVRLRDEVILARVAAEDKDTVVRQAAVGQLTNQVTLAKIALEDKDTVVRQAAVGQLTNQVTLAKIALEHKEDTRVRQAAVRRLTDQVTLAKIALEDKDIEVRLQAVYGLTDQAVLATVAVEKWGANVSRTAANKVADQTLLMKVVMEAKDWDVRKAAFGRLREEPMLAKVASDAPDEALRMAARVRLGRSTWKDVLQQAGEDSAKVGPALAAIALEARQDSVANDVEILCHRYIRKGDIALITELSELLRLYGTKVLAEDYLNCGQRDLADAGRAWAYAHGYSVSAGQGSHRVRWGGGGR